MRTRAGIVRVSTLVVLGVAQLAVAQQQESPSEVSFVADIAPIMLRHCQSCHGPRTAENNYRVDSFEHLMRAGDNEMAPATSGDLDESEIYRLIISDDRQERMPNNGETLSDDEIGLIRNWITQGAAFDGDDPTMSLADLVPRQPFPAAPETYARPMPITAMTFSADGSRIYVSGYHEITIWNPNDGSLIGRLGNVAQRTYGMALSLDETLLAAAGGAPGVSGDVRLLSPSDGSVVRHLCEAEDVFFDVAFRPDGERVAVSGADGSVRVFDVDSGAERIKIDNHSDWVVDVCWSADGSRLATASRDKTAKVFDAESGELVATYSGHQAAVEAVTFKPEGSVVISAGADRRIRAWKIEDASLVKEMASFSGDVNELILADGELIGASSDNTARRLKAEELEQVQSLADHPDWVLSLANHAATQRLGTGCFDGTVTIWNREDGNQLQRFLAVPRPDSPQADP